MITSLKNNLTSTAKVRRKQIKLFVSSGRFRKPILTGVINKHTNQLEKRRPEFLCEAADSRIKDTLALHQGQGVVHTHDSLHRMHASDARARSKLEGHSFPALKIKNSFR